MQALELAPVLLVGAVIESERIALSTTGMHLEYPQVTMPLMPRHQLGDQLPGHHVLDARGHLIAQRTWMIVHVLLTASVAQSLLLCRIIIHSIALRNCHCRHFRVDSSICCQEEESMPEERVQRQVRYWKEAYARVLAGGM